MVLRGHPELHVICLFTRLRHCALLQAKTASEVCHSLVHLWIKYYGPPVLWYTDLGREFDNDLMRLFAEKYGIALRCAPGGAHWSHGGVERQHYQLRHTVELVLEAEESLSLQDACDVACLTAISHPMADRAFSPQQLVYGVSARWPDFVSAELPALSNSGVASDHVGHYLSKFLDSMYRAREKFHVADIRAKISLPEKHRPSTNRDVVLAAGDMVFYYESTEKGQDTWRGPAAIIGVDGDFVLLRHGGSVRRLPLLHCRPASDVLGAEVPAELEELEQPREDTGVLDGIVDEAGNDEAGNELNSQEIAELRRDGHARVSNAPEVRDPVLTRSCARAVLVALAQTDETLLRECGDNTSLSRRPLFPGRFSCPTVML